MDGIAPKQRINALVSKYKYPILVAAVGLALMLLPGPAEKTEVPAVTAEIELDDELQPRAVALTGAASPIERQELTEALVRELGLTKEAVTWTGSNQSSE